MHVHQQAVPGSQFAGIIQGFHAVFPRKLKMRDGAQRVHALFPLGPVGADAVNGDLKGV